MSQLQEIESREIQDIINAHPHQPHDPFRYSQTQIKHIRDALIELARSSSGAKKIKLEILSINMNAIFESMRVSDQEFVYIKSKLN